MDSAAVINIAQIHLNVTLKDEQLEAACSYMKGNDTILIAPTGYGKSVLYLLAPFLHDTELYNIQKPELHVEKPHFVKKLFSNQPKTAQAQFLIVLPLTSMIDNAMLSIKDKFPQLSAIHLSAATAHLCKAAVFIFTSPESIVEGTSRKALQEGLNIKAVFIDEFHIVEQWGCDKGKKEAFRDCYGKLSIIRSYLTNVPFIAMSATATESTINTVNESLQMQTPTIIKVSINKSNIMYHSLKVTGSVLSDFKWLCNMINTTDVELPRMLIFFTNINTLVDAYQYIILNTRQPVGTSTPTVVMYHLITDSAIKSRVLADLGNTSGFVRVSLCSSSLSMGLNLVNITYIIHYGVPSTASAFLQESGRASRETEILAHSILLTFPRMSSGRKIEDAMKQYSKGELCLRNILLNEFGCNKPSEQKPCCQVCDPQVSCHVKSLILGSYDTSVTDSFSDSLSIASVGDVDMISELD